MDTPLHTIDAVARRTGLSAHVIRIWEKRYRAVEPARTASNRRQYSEENVERLSLLRELTRSGQSIGAIARLPTEKLRGLAASVGGGGDRPQPVARVTPASAAAIVDDAFTAIQNLDARVLEIVLRRAELAFGTQGMLQRVAAPLAQRMGDLWREGTITAAHEHFASSVLRTFLGHAARGFAAEADAPLLVVATPAGQLHELGALLVAALAANLGWRVTYLGASLPAAEIAGAAVQNRARAVALSLVYPADDAKLGAELVRLRELLPPEVAVLVGGRALPAYRPVLDRIGAFSADELTDLGGTLDRLRQSPTRVQA
ncbi:MerR family transcriptional regulator [Opitutus terrae]|uniref:Transcriptional regulator, MerR family n=1 Tax=Opitutus terrae (strain DSM 11246 / JCM 15787 / PB90-1) TaxID=452637 RepID=B1ZNG1_OPITP|nr:MerR family transcriptional regulator [Opitutus terrae]ACB74395.1 transcriptional regulator, MerR family [Opitutus terrae PB90-1]